ncbi:MAG: hypothetical protein NVS4B12_27450 [Ktedonobacteraceae bacterium]
MPQSPSAFQEVNPLPPRPSKQQLSLRTFLWKMAGLAFTGGSLIPLATACDPTSGATSASQPTVSPTLGKTLFTYRGQKGQVNAVTWSPDGKRIASGGTDTTVRVWQAQ